MKMTGVLCWNHAWWLCFWLRVTVQQWIGRETKSQREDTINVLKVWKILNRTTRSNQIPFRNKLMQAEFQECLLLFGIGYLVYRSQSINRNIKIYRTFTLTFDLYGCKTWSVTLREVYRLRVFKNRVLREITGPKRDEKIEEWRRTK
jgi:hypothetical protein